MYTRITRHTGEPRVRLAVAITLMALAAGLAASGAARAGEHGITVRYSTATLEAPASAGMLYGRLEAAAADVCESSGRRSLERARLEARCTADALDRAVEGIGSRLLSQIHADRGNGTRVAKR